MTTLDNFTFVNGFGARLAEVAHNFVRATKNRRHVNSIMQMSDQGLADIGLMRTDLEVVMRVPSGVDPTVRLTRFARERSLKGDLA